MPAIWVIDQRRLRWWGKEHDWMSLNEIAMGLGVAPSTLSRVVNGKSAPGETLLASMFLTFGSRGVPRHRYRGGAHRGVGQMLTPQQRRERARIAANERWSRPGAREAQSATLRAAVRARLAAEVDPEGTMGAEELNAAVANAAKAPRRPPPRRPRRQGGRPMTAATAHRFERKDHGKGHSYYLDGKRLPGVTTILDAALRKRALENWAADTTAEYAVNNWATLDGLPVSERFKTLKGARWETRDAALLTGTQFHDLVYMVRDGAPVEVPEQHLGRVQAAARWMDKHRVEPLVAERPVWHETDRWAGTIDLLAGIGGTLWLLDWKTGKGVYPETALQLAAYAHAQYVLREDDTPAAWTPPERCGAIHVGADSVELHPVDASDAAYMTFRYAQQVAAWAEACNAAFKDRRPWPIGPATDPDAAEGVAS